MKRLASQLRALALGMVASLLPAMASAQPGVQPIVASVEIEAPSFDAYSATSRAEIKRALGKALAEHGSDHFPFLDWTVASESTAEQALPELRAHIVQDDESEPFPRILLLLDAKLGGEALELPRVEELELYSDQDPNPPTHDPDRLERDVERTLKLSFRKPAFRDALHSDFLSQVSLTRRVDVAPEKHRVLLPIHWQRSRIGFDSRLRVRFVAPGESGGSQPGTMKLGQVERSLAPPQADGLESAVIEFSFAPMNLSDGHWDDAIAGIVGRCEVEGVYMDSYTKNVNRSIEGNLVTRPD